MHTGHAWGNLMERDHLDDPDVDGRIILRRIFNKWDFGAWIVHCVEFHSTFGARSSVFQGDIQKYTEL